MQTPKNETSLYIKLLSTLFQTGHVYRKLFGSIMSSHDIPGLTAWPIIMMKHLGNEIRPGELARALDLDPSSVVRITDMLVGNGLAEKEWDQQDRRAKILRLTARGKKIAVQIETTMGSLFRQSLKDVTHNNLLCCLCTLFEKDSENKHRNLFGFEEWLNAISQRKPELALAAAETYLTYVSNTKSYFYDHDNQLVQLMTRLFAEAEEREESDGGKMLQRVVSLQDLLLSLGVNSMNEWLKAAERQ
ncbi:MarR family transcriptional regulator [Oxalobacter sp. OttesenSCG-928-P03]|nr:MarR family transcriptional regulator [Oxalobacter sp. OttesenSCG-928-P03]